MASSESFLRSASEPRVVCRPALESDTPTVLEFTSRIWEGHDYIKYVWREWMEDPQGLLAVAQFGPRAVGIAKTTLISPHQWWLEGLRVDPDYRGLKIASHLHEYMDAWWLVHGDGILRLMTSSERVQVHHLCERTGYSKVGAVKGYDASALGDSTDAFELVAPTQVAQAAEFVAAHPSDFSTWMDWDWRVCSPDLLALQLKAEQQQLFWWRGRRGIFAAWVDKEERKLGVAVVSCDPAALVELLMDVRRLAAQQGWAAVRWHAPTLESLQPALTAAGFTTDWDDSGFFFAKPHPGP